MPLQIMPNLKKVIKMDPIKETMEQTIFNLNTILNALEPALSLEEKGAINKCRYELESILKNIEKYI
jgi:hypothetical protein